MDNKLDINDIIKVNAKLLVGILCKRIELIEKINDDKPSKELIKLYPKLFRSLVKELVWENSRMLKQKLAYLSIPTVVYKGGNPQ